MQYVIAIRPKDVEIFQSVKTFHDVASCESVIPETHRDWGQQQFKTFIKTFTRRCPSEIVPTNENQAEQSFISDLPDLN